MNITGIAATEIVVLVTFTVLMPGIVISSIEDAVIPVKYFTRNLLDWRYCLAFQPIIRPKRPGALSNAAFGHAAFQWISILRGTSYCIAFGLVVVTPEWSSTFLFLTIACYAYLFYRIPYSLDGSDQMALFSLVCLTVMSIDNFSERYVLVGSSVLTMHAIISYLTSGAAKLVGPLWRNGEALSSVLCSAEFGHSYAGRLLRFSPTLSMVLAWCVIGGHIIVAFTFIAGGDLAFIGIAIGFMFHMAVAVFMRLNVFVWSFGATYPSVIFMSDYENRIAMLNVYFEALR